MVQIDAISTLVMSTLLKDGVRRSQSLLADAQKEFSTGRHADMGLALGERTGRDLLWRAQLDELRSLSDHNKLSGNRLDLVQSTLNSVRDVANTFLQTLTGTRNSADGQVTAKLAASSALALARRTPQHQLQRSGPVRRHQHRWVSAVTEYEATPASAAQSSVAGAFFTAFGLAQSDPGVAAITGPDMQAFLDADFAALFQPAQWQADWSSASNTNMTVRIDTGLTIEAGSNANLAAFRQLAEAFTMVLDLGTGQLNQNAFEAITDAAIKLAGEGILGVGFEQARLGIAESEITAANERIGLRMTTITGGISAIEDVDKYEAALRVTTLQTQLEASYTLTGRIGRLSILNYI